MCKEEQNGTTVCYAVCPKVLFTQNNQGKMTFADGDSNSFTYILLSDSTIEFSFKGDPFPFKGNKYFYKIYEETIKFKTYEDIPQEVKLEKFEIFTGDKKSRYFLSREKR